MTSLRDVLLSVQHEDKKPVRLKLSKEDKGKTRLLLQFTFPLSPLTPTWSSPCHLVTLSPCHLATLSLLHPVTSSSSSSSSAPCPHLCLHLVLVLVLSSSSSPYSPKYPLSWTLYLSFSDSSLFPDFHLDPHVSPVSFFSSPSSFLNSHPLVSSLALISTCSFI